MKTLEVESPFLATDRQAELRERNGNSRTSFVSLAPILNSLIHSGSLRVVYSDGISEIYGDG